MPSPAAIKKIIREVNEMRKNPPESIRLQVNEDDMLDVTGIIEGPEGTPYAGGYFNVRFKFTDEYPAAPPKCWFSTKLFHPNVGPTGEICVNTLKKDWKATYGIQHILVTVKCLLIYPNPESALDEEAGKMIMEDYESYCSRAKLITSVHATPRVRPAEFDTPSKGAAAPAQPPAASSSSSISSQAPTASTSQLPASSSTTTCPAPPPMSRPPVSRKSASPGPQQMFMKSALSADKDALAARHERHPSPSPLGTADANVVMRKVVPGVGMGMAHGASGAASGAGNKAVKRSATGSGATNAEKRKKALKRL